MPKFKFTVERVQRYTFDAEAATKEEALRLINAKREIEALVADGDKVTVKSITRMPDTFRRRGEVVQAITVSDAIMAHEEDALPDWLAEATKYSLGHRILSLDGPDRAIMRISDGTRIGEPEDWIVRYADQSIGILKPAFFETIFDLI